MNPNGTLVGSAAIFVRTTNGISTYGIELFFTRYPAVFANVPGFQLPSGITYTPPAH